jgi:hypothetical protein
MSHYQQNGNFPPKRLQKVGQKEFFFQKRTGEVIENKWLCVKIGQKRTENEPKNEAEKLLKTRDCIKNEPKTNRNEPKNEAGHVIENKRGAKNEPENLQPLCGFEAACFLPRFSA